MIFQLRLFLPFVVELIGDWFLIRKNKKDLPMWLRVMVISALSVDTIGITAITLNNHDMALGYALYPFFDPILAWMRGKRGLDYQGKTKWYDRVFLAWLNKTLNPRVVMVLRGILCAALLTFGLWK